ncbi:hypothetical protein C8R44DRAFT_772400 [Mycena epipterygia]|nr:hypothetical protein C8R44DRAFT_772400 [Mycena epipterygia]
MMTDAMSPFLTSPYDDFLTTPLFGGDLDDFGLRTSPDDTPYSAFLSTPGAVTKTLPDESPVIPWGDEDVFVHHDDGSAALFGATTYDEHDADAPAPKRARTESAPVVPPPPQRRATATGTRAHATPIPYNAPTQPRANMANRKRGHSEAFAMPAAPASASSFASFPARPSASSHTLNDDDDDEEDDLDTSHLDPIARKRRKNTLAAKKSRRRKAQHLSALQAQVDELKRESERWRTRALMGAQMMKLQGLGADFGWENEQ